MTPPAGMRSGEISRSSLDPEPPHSVLEATPRPRASSGHLAGQPRPPPSRAPPLLILFSVLLSLADGLCRAPDRATPLNTSLIAANSAWLGLALTSLAPRLWSRTYPPRGSFEASPCSDHLLGPLPALSLLWTRSTSVQLAGVIPTADGRHLSVQTHHQRLHPPLDLAPLYTPPHCRLGHPSRSVSRTWRTAHLWPLPRKPPARPLPAARPPSQPARALLFYDLALLWHSIFSPPSRECLYHLYQDATSIAHAFQRTALSIVDALCLICLDLFTLLLHLLSASPPPSCPHLSFFLTATMHRLARTAGPVVLHLWERLSWPQPAPKRPPAEEPPPS